MGKRGKYIQLKWHKIAWLDGERPSGAKAEGGEENVRRERPREERSQAEPRKVDQH